MSSKFIEIKNLKTHFFVDKDKIKAVNGVSLEIKENTTLGLVGESGCGKSFLAMSLIKIFSHPEAILSVLPKYSQLSLLASLSISCFS